MKTYIMLLNWTKQGIQNIKDSPSRVDAARKAFQDAGVVFKDFYMTIGQYDMIAVCEAPDDETIAKLALVTASAGNVRTETLRAFTEDEYRKIIGELP